VIIRTPGRDRYVIISKVPLEDSRLSWKARGIHAYLLSKPDNWEVMVSQLVNEGPDGKESVLSGLKELEKYGYITRIRQRGVDGSYDSMKTEVFEEPIIPGQTTNGFSSAGLSSPGKPATNEYINIKNNEVSESTSVQKRKNKKVDYSADFEEVWEIYPRRVNKAGAYKAYCATVKRGASICDLMNAATEYATRRAGQDESYTLHCSTFFGPDERWRDYLPILERMSEADLYAATIYDLYDSGCPWDGESNFDNPAKYGYTRPVDSKGRLIDGDGRPFEINTASGARKYIVESV
jgi:hypothetical protein